MSLNGFINNLSGIENNVDKDSNSEKGKKKVIR